MLFTRDIGVLVFISILTHCATKRPPSASRVQAVAHSPYQGLDNQELNRLIVKANGDWNNTETKMAWLTLASNFLGHMDSARRAIVAMPPSRPAAGLNLAAEAPAIDPLAEQKIQMQWAEQSTRSGLDQSRLMLDYDRASGDYDIRRQELLKGYDKQTFDNAISAAKTSVEIQGNQIENFQKLIEAKKKIIENQILGNYANAFNSYVRSYHEYTLTIATVMRGAKKVSQKASVLANSIMEYDKRVRHCASAQTAQTNQNMRTAIRNLALADYSKLLIQAESSVAPRVQAVTDLPHGSECLELGLIQANMDEFPSSEASDAYPVASPIFRLLVDPNPRGPVAARTIAACPALESGSDPLGLRPHAAQIMGISGNIQTAADSLEVVNGYFSNSISSASEIVPNSNVPDETAPTLGQQIEVGSAVDLGVAYLTDVPRADNRELIIPFPATPFQVTMQVAKGQIEFRSPGSTTPVKPYCSVRPSDAPGKQNLKIYVDSVRKYEAQRAIKLRRDLEVAGVRFDSAGKIQLDSTPYNGGSLATTDTTRVNALVRRGLFLAQRCTRMTVEHVEQAEVSAGQTSVTLPQATDVSVGLNKYTFFYPPYSLGDDQTTLGSAMVKATRTCMDNALLSLSQSQQALSAASEFYKFFGEAANIHAPAAPIPYVPNPPPGSIVYGR